MDIKDLQEKMKENPFLNLSDVIYDFLFDDIIHLRIPPEQKINEKQISESLGVSRSPVSSALQRLCRDHLLIKDGRKSLYAAPMTRTECLQLYESRIGLEGYAAYLSVFRIAPDQIARLKSSIHDYEKTIIQNAAEQADYDTLFHSTIIDAAQNPYLAAMYKTTEFQLLRYRNSLSHVMSHDILHSILLQSCRSHYAILNAIKLGFADTARKEMENHISMMLGAISEWK